jgi:hypothetical protein
MSTKTLYQRFYSGDLPIGGGWLEEQHYRTNIEVLGPPRYGKTTLVEHLILEALAGGSSPAGILHIDPTGDGYRKLLGWAAESRIDRPVWLVDLDETPLRFNPLAVAKRDPDIYVSGLYEALHMTQATEASTQHRQMRRFVTATLHALIENDLTLADAVKWLKKPGFRTPGMIRAIRNEEARLEWESNPSGARLESTENWFHIFSEDPLRSMFSGNGFSWDAVYDEQPLVLVNLGSRKLGTSVDHRKAIAAMFIVSLFTAAFEKDEEKRRPWYVIIDDATNYTPPHIGPLLVESEGHRKLFFILMHHTPFDGPLQRSVDVGCRSKFFFGRLPEKRDDFSGSSVPRLATVHVFDGHYLQTLQPEKTPDLYQSTTAFKERVFAHPWYGPAPAPPTEASKDGPGPTRAAPEVGAPDIDMTKPSRPPKHGKADKGPPEPGSRPPGRGE